MNLLDLREPASAWTHFAGLLLSIPGTVYLWRRGRGGPPARRLSLLVFGLSLIFCYAASTLYHGVRVSGDGLSAFDRLDRVGIFILIAGTYTPLAWTLLRGRWRWVTLSTVWLIATIASALLIVGGPFPPAWSTGLYLGMGWGVVACYAELARVTSHRALIPARRRRGLLQRGVGPQPAAMARPLAGGVRPPRFLPPLRDRRQPVPLPGHPPGRRAARSSLSVKPGHPPGFEITDGRWSMADGRWPRNSEKNLRVIIAFDFPGFPSSIDHLPSRTASRPERLLDPAGDGLQDLDSGPFLVVGLDEDPGGRLAAGLLDHLAGRRPRRRPSGLGSASPRA